MESHSLGESRMWQTHKLSPSTIFMAATNHPQMVGAWLGIPHCIFRMGESPMSIDVEVSTGHKFLVACNAPSLRPLPGGQMTDIKVVMIHWVTSLGCSCQSMDSVRSWIFCRNGPANGWVIFSKATRSWVPNVTLQKCRKVKTPACKTGGKWRFHFLRVTLYGFVWEYDTLKSQRLILIFLQNMFRGYPPSD